jgi:hypothetical protein
MKRALPFLLILAVACGQDQIPTPQRSLDRPADVTAACVMGAPSSPTHAPDRVPVPPAACTGQNTGAMPSLRLLGFLTNSATGEVAVAGLSETNNSLALLLDLDGTRPGYNFLPVGRLPNAVVTTTDGCSVIVANEGSCDLSAIDVAQVANGAEALIVAPGAVRQVPVKVGGMQILARPHALVPVPTPPPAPGAPPACAAASHAYVSFPGCDLVAEIDMATGNYVRGVQVKAAGATILGAPPTCAVECAGGNLGTGAAIGETNPDALALSDDGKTLYIGGESSRFVTAVSIDPASGNFQTVRQLELDRCVPPMTTPPLGNTDPRCDPVGVTRLRLTPPAVSGPTSLNTAGNFLYAVTLDASIRVIDVDQFRECETQADPQMVDSRFPPPAAPPGSNIHPAPGSGVPAQYQTCMLIDDTTQPLLRRAGVRGPGIRVAAAPVDVAFGQVTNTGPGNDPTLLQGTFGYSISSNGVLTVINVSPQKDVNNTTANVPHNRNINTPGMAGTTGDATSGGPRLDTSSLRVGLASNVGADPTQVPQLARTGQTCPGDTTLVPAIHWPDVYGVKLETWTFGYEAALPNMTRGNGKLGAADVNTMTMLDPGAGNCKNGVLPGDFVLLASCQDNTGCPTGEACFGAIAGHAGVCLALVTTASGQQTTQPACLDMVGLNGSAVASRHEFRVRLVSDGNLVLDERPLILPRPGGCTSDADCANLDTIAAFKNAHLFPKSQFICDPTPVLGTGTRSVRQCVATCDAPKMDPMTGRFAPNDDQCGPEPNLSADPTVSGLYSEWNGYVCGGDGIDGKPGKRRCVSSRVPRDPPYNPDPTVGQNAADACFILPIAYEVHSGSSFVFVGDRTGFLHNQVEAADGSCVADPTVSPKQIGRLSYNAPFCPSAFPTDYDAGARAGTGANNQPICVWDSTKPPVQPNPCFRVVPLPVGPPQLVWQMENVAFAAAIGPAAPLGMDGAPLAPTFGNQLAFSFALNGGFAPLALLTGAVLPVVAHNLPGPPPNTDQWIYLIDQGDQVSGGAITLLLGQMLRIDALNVAIDTHTTVQ